MNSPTHKRKSDFDRLEARISSEKKSLLKHAADLVGRTLTDFVVHAAYEAATRVIREHERIRLSMKDREEFIKALQYPPAPSDSLIKASKKYKKEVSSK